MMPPEDHPARFPPLAETPFLRACRQAEKLPRDDLLGVAIARGCTHYAPLWPNLRHEDSDWLPHEVLGCALLRGVADAETFQAIRCGAMVLSDLHNDPALIAAAAERLAVLPRVTHLAKQGLHGDDQPEFWTQVRRKLPRPAARHWIKARGPSGCAPPTRDEVT
jgi:hypothetical protein